MSTLKKSLVIGVGLVTLGAGSLGVVSAATADTGSSGDTSLVQKIAEKFGLKESEVQTVFDEERETRHAEMEASRAEALKQAVTDGKLTQAQADYITKFWDDMEASRPTDGTKPTDAEREAMKTKMDELRTWLDEQNIDLSSIDGLGGPGFGGHGFGGPRGERPADDSSSSTSSTTTSES